jgi:hypothetical protein
VTELITALCSVAGTFLVVWSTIIYPRSKEKKKNEEDAEKKEAERNQDIDGVEAVNGEVIVPRLVTRVKAVETEMKKVTAGQSLLERRMDEANGTGRETRAEVAHITAAVEEVRRLVADVAAADLAKKTDLEIAAKKVAADAVGRQVEILSALAEHND